MKQRELDCKDIKVSDFIFGSAKLSHSFFFPISHSLTLRFSTVINERVLLRHFNEKLFTCFSSVAFVDVVAVVVEVGFSIARKYFHSDFIEI